MSLYCRVIQPEDIEEIVQLETEKMKESHPDETERTFASWHARWRKESLDYYIPMGWCFLARDPEIKSTSSSEGALVGYFLAQPFLFVDGMTQTFWVEHLSYNSLQARDELCELAYKMSREKHFQKIIFPNQSGHLGNIKSLNPIPWNPDAQAVKTSKI